MRTIADEETMAAGVKRQRVLTFVESLHRDGAITYEQYSAAGILRNQLMMEWPTSEGISPVYDGSSRHSEPSRKADRVGQLHTGYSIRPDGEIRYQGRRSRRNERRLEDAIFAAVGLHDDAGQRIVNIQHAEILIRIVTHTEKMPTLKGLGSELTHWVRIKEGKDKGNEKPFYGEKSKQTPPFAMGHISVWLGRLAQYYGLSK